MPTPAKTTNQDIVAAARRLLEAEGDDFSMATLAEQVGIRAPSLYKRFRDRAAILAAVEEVVIKELGEVLARALKRKSQSPLSSAAHAYRKFAKANPRSYPLMFARSASFDDSVQTARQMALAPILVFLEESTDASDALSAARFLTAFLHGFVSMEIAGAFRLGGDVDQAFDDGLQRALGGLDL